MHERDLYSVSYKIKQPLQKRVMSNIDSAIERVDALGWRRRFESRLPRSPWN
jgi:predicted RNA-binding protein